MVRKLKKIEILEPVIGLQEKKNLNNCFKLNQFSTYGTYAHKLERACSQILKTKYNLATTSGSVSLYISYKALGVKKNDLVVVPDYTFAASINSIVLNNASPWLIDIKKENLCLDIDLLEKIFQNCLIRKGKFYYHKIEKKRVFGVCPVLTLGNIPDLDKLKKLSKKYNLKIIIDAACALGNTYKSKPISDYADLCIYSFNGNKTITGGGGGLISTKYKRIYEFCKKFSNNGRTGRYDYSDIGFNFKITNLHASIAFAQLKKFTRIVYYKNLIRKKYKKIFQLDNIHSYPSSIAGKNYNWINYIIFKSAKTAKLALSKLNKKNILTYYFWKPISLQRIKKYCFLEKSYKNSNFIFKRLIPLPSSINIKSKDINVIIREIKLLNK